MFSVIPAMRSTLVFSILLLCISIEANVEKITFLGPKLLPTNEQFLNAPLLSLEALNPSRLSLRRQLLARFPSTPSPWELSETWMLLNGLKEGQRYELRVCWSASQPTAFALSVYDQVKVFRTLALNTSLHDYSKALLGADNGGVTTSDYYRLLGTNEATTSLLHISAAADYFSKDPALMRDGLMVDVDIILDPYLFNVFPTSLLPTAVYLMVLAVISWNISGFVWHWLNLLAQSESLSPQQQAATTSQKKTK